MLLLLLFVVSHTVVECWLELGAWSLEALPSGWLDWPCHIRCHLWFKFQSLVNMTSWIQLRSPKIAPSRIRNYPFVVDMSNQFYLFHLSFILLLHTYRTSLHPDHVTRGTLHSSGTLHSNFIMIDSFIITHVSPWGLSLSIFICIYFVSNHTTAFDCTKCDCIIRIHFGQWITTGLGQRGHNDDTDQGRFARGERGDCSVDRSRRGITRWWDRIVRDDDPFGLARGGDL